MDWQPIETAPKDGTRIIVSKINGPVWCDVKWEKMKRVPDRWASFICRLPFEPTHWMPTPEPPSSITCALCGKEKTGFVCTECADRCPYCGAGNDSNHSYDCPTGLHPDRK